MSYHMSLFQFQFLVFRLFSEARAPLPREDAAGLPWRPPCLSPTDWKTATLALWRQGHFQELLTGEFCVGRPSPAAHLFPTWVCER